MYAANFPYRARAPTATGGSNWGSVEVIDLEDLYWWGCVVGDDVVMMSESVRIMQ